MASCCCVEFPFPAHKMPLLLSGGSSTVLKSKQRFVTDFSSHVATATVSRKKTVLNSVEQCPDGSLWLLSQSLWWPSLQYFIWFLMALPVVLFLKSNWQAKNKAKI
jgi:hypothetical protein